MLLEAVYQQDLLDGEVVTRDPNTGGVSEKALYKAGVLDGTVLKYHPNGKLKEKAVYKAGELQGEPLEYDDKGKRIKKDKKDAKKKGGLFGFGGS